MREECIRNLKTFLQNNHPGIQAFDCRNIAGDYMEVVYVDESQDDKEDIVVEYAPYWGYLEIFGLTDDEFNDLIKHDYTNELRDFGKEELENNVQ